MEGVDRFCFRRRVEFSETDLAGIVHFSNYFRYMESAEHAFYRSLGFSVHDFRPTREGERIGWPRVHAEADFRLPLEFEEEVEIELLVAEVRAKAIRYQFRFWKDPDGRRELAAMGGFVVVCIRMAEGRAKMAAIEIPSSVRERLRVAPAEELALKLRS